MLKIKVAVRLIALFLFSSTVGFFGVSIPNDLNRNDQKHLNHASRKAEVILDERVFRVSYNEIYEQPNWVEYTVRDIVKKADRKGLRFRTDPSVHTSDDADYYDNPWDRGHMAPAGSFTDSYENLKATFSYTNIALQKDQLNRGEWAALEEQVRRWAKTRGPVKVRIELLFEKDTIRLPSGATVPTAFIKRLQFSDGEKRCYEFLNTDTQTSWENFQTICIPTGLNDRS